MSLTFVKVLSLLILLMVFPFVGTLSWLLFTISLIGVVSFLLLPPCTPSYYPFIFPLFFPIAVLILFKRLVLLIVLEKLSFLLCFSANFPVVEAQTSPSITTPAPISAPFYEWIYYVLVNFSLFTIPKSSS